MSDESPEGTSTADGEPRSPERLRLGHISYSNCFPAHARLIDRPRAGDPALIVGAPAALNALLADGSIDAAPASSIEYALHPDRYRILPDLVIGARGDVRSIIFASDRDPAELSGLTVALPTASATSVVLLKILLRVRWGVTPRFRWFDQTREDPFASGAAAALFIGDVALLGGAGHPSAVRLDLGMEWWQEMGLPFAFAVWQTTAPAREARRLHEQLLESREYGESSRAALAARYADHFHLSADELHRYWDTLIYQLDAPMIEGLQTFYRLAWEIGELPAVPKLRWLG